MLRRLLARLRARLHPAGPTTVGRLRNPTVYAHVPWTAAQVDNLLWRQARIDRHPYTCPRHSDRPLVPTELGWRCTKFTCLYVQTWALRADTDAD